MILLKNLLEKIRKLNRKLLIAMICYGAILGIALYGLLPVRSKEEIYLLFAVLLITFLFIIKTLAHSSDQ